jgi:LacI family transcriptional regulator
MAHPYPVRDIAQQSGLSEATVDRVLNGRPGVRPSTARQVHQAIADLDRQQSQFQLGGRTFLVDLVMQSPERFTKATRSALVGELPQLRPAVLRSRFHLWEKGPPGQLVGVLDRIRRRGSHGVILKAPNVPEVVESVNRLVDGGIPVVTVFTDLPASPRLAYVGIDNAAAGATAAYLIGQWLGDRPGDVLVIVSSAAMRGEEERELGFRSSLGSLSPERAVFEVTDSDGLDESVQELVLTALREHPSIRAVYSVGGGNVAALQAFADLDHPCLAYIGHDLDEDNLRLLTNRRLSAVLHHDLGADLRRCCQLIMMAQGALPGPIHSWPSNIQVITPFNVPGMWARER